MQNLMLNVHEARAENQAKALGQAAFKAGLNRNPFRLGGFKEAVNEAGEAWGTKLANAYRFGFDQAKGA